MTTSSPGPGTQAAPSELSGATPAPAPPPGDPTDADPRLVPAGATGGSAWDLLRSGGPRFARDAFGPALAFYVAFRLSGSVPVGIALATAVALAAWLYERSKGRTGNLSRLSLGIIVVQAVVGLLANDAKVYLGQPVLVSGVYGMVFLGSVVIKRPLAGVFAAELHAFPPEVRASDTFRSVFSRISLVWGLFMVTRSLVRVAVLMASDIEGFLVFNFATGAPLATALMVWSVWYGRRGFEKRGVGLGVRRRLGHRPRARSVSVGHSSSFL